MNRMLLEPGLSLEEEDGKIRVLLRSDPVYGLEVKRDGTGKVDTEEHTISGATTVQGGRTVDDRFELDRKFLDQVVQSGNEADKGIRVRFDHPNASSRSLGSYLGRATNFRRRGNRVLADIGLTDVSSISPDGDLLQYIEQMAVKEPDSFAMSIVFTTERLIYRRTEDGDLETDEDGNVKPPVPRLKKLWAADFVDEGAATDGLFGASGTPSDVMSSFLDRYFRSRGFTDGSLLMPKKPKAVEPDATTNSESVDETANLATENVNVQLSATASGDDVPIPGTVPVPVPLAPRRSVPPPPAVDPEVLSAAVEGETKRVLEIQALAARFQCDALGRKLIAEGVALGDSVTTILGQHVEKPAHQPVSAHINPDRLSVGEDGRDRFKAIMGNLLMSKVGMIQLSPEQRQDIGSVQHWNLMSVADECCRRAGINTGGLDKMTLAALAMDGTGMKAHQMGLGAMGSSTSDFPALLENIMNKSLQTAYTQAGTTWQAWTRRGSVSDFREFSRVRVSESDDLELVLEGAEFQDSGLIDRAEKGRAYTYGKVFSVTRQTVVNDDLAEIMRQPRRFGDASARLVDNLLYADLLQAELGPPMVDVNPLTGGTELTLFNTGASWPDGRANYLAHATETSLTPAEGQAAINRANLMMRLRKGLKFIQRLNVSPRWLLCPPELEMNARLLLQSTSNLTDAKNAGVINPWQGYVEPVVIPHLSDTTYTAGSAVAWFLAADANQYDTYEVFFLDGFSQPTLEQEIGFLIDGIKFKVRVDVGVKCIDTVGMVRMKGAA